MTCESPVPVFDIGVPSAAEPATAPPDLSPRHARLRAFLDQGLQVCLPGLKRTARNDGRRFRYAPADPDEAARGRVGTLHGFGHRITATVEVHSTDAVWILVTFRAYLGTRLMHTIYDDVFIEHSGDEFVSANLPHKKRCVGLRSDQTDGEPAEEIAAAFIVAHLMDEETRKPVRLDRVSQPWPLAETRRLEPTAPPLNACSQNALTLTQSLRPFVDSDMPPEHDAAASEHADPFTPDYSPSQALWANLVTLLPEMITELLVPDAHGINPRYEPAHAVGFLLGDIGIVRFPDHRLSIGVDLFTLAERPDAPREERQCVTVRVRFDDPAQAIPEMSLLLLVSRDGIPDSVLLQGMEEVRYSDATVLTERLRDLVKGLIRRGQFYRSAYRLSVQAYPDMAPDGAQHRAAAPATRYDGFTEGPAPQDAAAKAAPEPGTSGRDTWRVRSVDGTPLIDGPIQAGPSETLYDADDAPHVPPLFPDLDPASLAGKTEIQLYDLAALRRELAVRPPDDDNDRYGPSHTKMLDRLNRLGPDGARRWLAHATPEMIAAVAAVGARAPHFAPVTDLVLDHARASHNTGTPMRLPPLLIIDEPGTGKTWYLTRLAQALGVPFTTVSMAAVTTGDTIQGSHPGWRNAAQGVVSKLLIAEPIANGMIFVDEFDKPTGAQGVQGSLYRPYYAALERENARRFTDEFLGIAIDASHLLWTLAANDIAPIPAPIRDRTTQVTLAPMTIAHRRVVAQSIYATCNVALRDWYEPEMAAATLAVLDGHTPRQMRKAIDAALVIAGAAARRALSPDDLRAGLARTIAESAPRAYGFVAGR